MYRYLLCDLSNLTQIGANLPPSDYEKSVFTPRPSVVHCSRKSGNGTSVALVFYSGLNAEASGAVLVEADGTKTRIQSVQELNARLQVT